MKKKNRTTNFTGILWTGDFNIEDGEIFLILVKTFDFAKFEKEKKNFYRYLKTFLKEMNSEVIRNFFFWQCKISILHL